MILIDLCKGFNFNELCPIVKKSYTREDTLENYKLNYPIKVILMKHITTNPPSQHST